jgi:hypothetical protein
MCKGSQVMRAQPGYCPLYCRNVSSESLLLFITVLMIQLEVKYDKLHI